MTIDKNLATIREQYNKLAARLHQAEQLKNAVSIDSIGSVIQENRKLQGLTRKALCDLSGISYSTLNKIETGSVSVRLDIIIIVTRTLGLNLWVG